MTENSGRQCIFCDHPANSYEHIFPDWINKIFPPGKIGPVASISTQVVIGNDDATNQKTFPANKLAQLTAKIVCCCCNGGWMGDMEGRASQLLPPSLLGHDATFDPEEQIFIAAWATKIAMLGETIMEYADSFTRDDRWLVRKQRRPPLHAMVYLAIYGGPNIGTAYFRSLGDITKDGVPLTNLYVHTIQIGRLIIQVRGFPTIPLSQNSSLKQLREARFIEIPIFPPVESCKWPPNFRFDDKALGIYTSGGKEPPVPPPGIALNLPEPTPQPESTLPESGVP
jgi:hypothetical protein